VKAVSPDLDFTSLFSDRARTLAATARNECLDDLHEVVVRDGLDDTTVWKRRPESVPRLLDGG
jgi:hypothetical protein